MARMELSKTLNAHRATLAIADHATYHSYLTRRILTLRRNLGLATSKSQKYSPREITNDDVAKDARHLELVLLQAERAWARAMNVKALRGEVEGGLTGRDRKEVISKCVKSARLAKKFNELVQQSSNVTSQDIVESTAYQSLMKGSALFEKLASGTERKSAADWEQCLVQWSNARVLYAVLVETTGSEAGKELVANTIDPTIRYAAYQAGIARTVSMQEVSRKYFTKDANLKKVVEELDPYALTGRPKAYGERTAKGEAPQTIAWRGRSANIVDASIGQALAGVYGAEAKLRAYLAENGQASARDKAAAYDEILIASQDAADATKRATDELEKEKVEESNPRMQNLRITSLAITYNLISCRIGRNRVLIGDKDGLLLTSRVQKKRNIQDKKQSSEESAGRKLVHLKERAVLLDAILQSIDSIKELRGAMRDEAFVQELDGKIAYFRALKCVNISYSHLLCGSQLNSLALLTRASELISSAALEGPAALRDGPLTLEIDQSTFEEARTTIARLQAQSHAFATLHAIEQNATIAHSKQMTSAEPWLNRMDDYPTPGVTVDLTRLVNYPPKIEPVPMKPIFLDVAWNYIDYPGHTTHLADANPTTTGAAAADNSKEEKKRGWFGFGR